jgi:hypothetical protein
MRFNIVGATTNQEHYEYLKKSDLLTPIYLWVLCNCGVILVALVSSSTHLAFSDIAFGKKIIHNKTDVHALGSPSTWTVSTHAY